MKHKSNPSTRRAPHLPGSRGEPGMKRIRSQKYRGYSYGTLRAEASGSIVLFKKVLDIGMHG